MFTVFRYFALIDGKGVGLRIDRGMFFQEYPQVFEIRFFEDHINVECRFVQYGIDVLDKVGVGINFFLVGGENTNSFFRVMKMAE